jgi:membrane protein required for beta-lactamase induction
MCYQIMGLGIFENRKLPLSSRLHESGMWQSLYRIEKEMVRVIRGQTGRLGSATGINLVAVKGLQWCF